jgi:hypothetical protein
MTEKRTMTNRAAIGSCTFVALAIAATPASAVDVDAVITVDNAYGFAFGSETGITTSSYFGGLRNTTAADITNGAPVLFNAGDANAGNGFTNAGVGPEAYDLNGLPASDYLYLIAWSDDASLQGAIGSFSVGAQTLGTVPNAGWQVYATGIDRDSNIASDTLTNSAADIALINQQIALANINGGGAGTSRGWVDENGLLPDGSPGSGALAFGDDNTGGSGGLLPFGAIQGVPSDARWMWYNEDPATISNPFTALPAGPDGHNEFLIFRIPVEQIPSPGTAALLVPAGCIAFRRRRR